MSELKFIPPPKCCLNCNHLKMMVDKSQIDLNDEHSFVNLYDSDIKYFCYLKHKENFINNLLEIETPSKVVCDDYEF